MPSGAKLLSSLRTKQVTPRLTEHRRAIRQYRGGSVNRRAVMCRLGAGLRPLRRQNLEVTEGPFGAVYLVGSVARSSQDLKRGQFLCAIRVGHMVETKIPVLWRLTAAGGNPGCRCCAGRVPGSGEYR